MEKLQKSNMKKLLASRELSLALVLIVLGTLFQIKNQQFLTQANLEDMLVNSSIMGVLAVGMMAVLLIGGIDISIGSTLAFSGMAMGLIMRDNPNIPTFILFLISIGIGLGCGFIIGLVIAKGKVIPIIATLGFMNILRGGTYLISNNAWVSAYQIPDTFKNFALGGIHVFGLFTLKYMVLVAIVCFGLFYFFSKFTPLGRKVYAVGSNPDAATISGINTDGIKIFVYSMMGSLAGLAGAMWVSKYASAQGDSAKGFEMDIIAACVIGGVNLSGGKGTVMGTILGVLTLGMLNNALPLMNVSSFWQDAIKGLIIIVAVILNTVAQRSAIKNNLKRRAV